LGQRSRIFVPSVLVAQFLQTLSSFLQDAIQPHILVDTWKSRYMDVSDLFLSAASAGLLVNYRIPPAINTTAGILFIFLTYKMYLHHRNVDPPEQAERHAEL
jgi:hypothetical protein